MNQATEKGNGIDLRPEWGIFIPSVLVIILISIPAVLYPKAAEEVVSAIYQPFARELRHALPVDHGGADHPVRLFRMQPVRRHQVRGPGREAGILPVFMDSHDLLFRGGRGGHVLVESSSLCGTSCSHRNTQRP